MKSRSLSLHTAYPILIIWIILAAAAASYGLSDAAVFAPAQAGDCAVAAQPAEGSPAAALTNAFKENFETSSRRTTAREVSNMYFHLSAASFFIASPAAAEKISLCEASAVCGTSRIETVKKRE